MPYQRLHPGRSHRRGGGGVSRGLLSAVAGGEQAQDQQDGKPRQYVAKECLGHGILLSGSDDFIIPTEQGFVKSLAGFLGKMTK